MSTGAKLRVVIADDNQLMRMGLRLLISTEPDLELVGEAHDGAQAFKLCSETKPDVLVVDLRMPVLDGISVTQKLEQASRDTKALVLSHYDGDENIFRALRAGALGYVTKDAPGEEVLKAIRAVARGERYLPAAVASQLAARAQFEELTNRERQVLTQVALGNSNREIGENLGIAERTVATHMQALLTKLGVDSRTEAVSVGRIRGLIS